MKVLEKMNPLPCHNCILFIICKLRYSRCEPIKCSVLQSYFSELKTLTAEKGSICLKEFNSLLWDQEIADNFIKNRRG